jgi:Ribbon-helix-helix protein, copG family
MPPRESSHAVRRRKSVRTSVLLPEDAHARIGKLAAANDVSAAWVIRHAVLEFLTRRGDRNALPLQMPRAIRAARADHA